MLRRPISFDTVCVISAPSTRVDEVLVPVPRNCQPRNVHRSLPLDRYRSLLVMIAKVTGLKITLAVGIKHRTTIPLSPMSPLLALCSLRIDTRSNVSDPHLYVASARVLCGALCGDPHTRTSYLDGTAHLTFLEVIAEAREIQLHIESQGRATLRVAGQPPGPISGTVPVDCHSSHAATLV